MTDFKSLTKEICPAGLCLKKSARLVVCLLMMLVLVVMPVGVVAKTYTYDFSGVQTTGGETLWFADDSRTTPLFSGSATVFPKGEIVKAYYKGGRSGEYFRVLVADAASAEGMFGTAGTAGSGTDEVRCLKIRGASSQIALPKYSGERIVCVKITGAIAAAGGSTTAKAEWTVSATAGAGDVSATAGAGDVSAAGVGSVFSAAAGSVLAAAAGAAAAGAAVGAAAVGAAVWLTDVSAVPASPEQTWSAEWQEHAFVVSLNNQCNTLCLTVTDNNFVQISQITILTAPTSFYESFNSNSSTGGNPSTPGSTATWVNTTFTTPSMSNEGWSSTNTYAAHKCILLGEASKKGSATTPTITLSGNADAVLLFKAAAYDTKDELLRLDISATNCTLAKDWLELTRAAWKWYSVKITNVTGPIRITFSGNYTKNNRIFLDEIFITSPHNVTISSANYATLGLPYSVIIPTGITAYRATTSGNNVTLTKLTGDVIPANMGVILYADTPGTYCFLPTSETNDSYLNQLVAVTEDDGYTCTGNDVGKVYYLGKDGGRVVFKKLNENGTVGLNKAFLKLENAIASDGKLEVNTEDGEATGIYFNDNDGDRGFSPALSSREGAMFNLQGMRVDGSYKGIVIRNGRKYLRY